MLSIWRRLPVVARAVPTGLVLSLVGTTPWAIFVSLNVRHWSAIPWAVLPTALYMWLFWRFVRGEGWPHSTAEARRKNCRANPLPPQVFGAALFAGSLGLVALVTFMRVMTRLVRLPAQQESDVSHIPFITLLGWVLMSAIVAGIAEESAFRGYMQGPIERRHGPVIAILITGGAFGFAHFSHPEVTLVLMPYFVAVAAIYGALAFLTNSIWPSMILHTGGNILASIGLLARGRAEWQASSSPKPLIWETGADVSFWISCLIFLIAVAAAVWAYIALARIARRTP